MPRRWTSFDADTTNREFAELPQVDFHALTMAMRLYRMEAPGGFVVKSYGEGLLMIKPANRTQGRCLFFSVSQAADEEVLMALLIYKKETPKVPDTILNTARQRLRRARENQNQ